MHDIVLRRGMIVDGTGQDGFLGDVAIDGATIVAVGEVPGKGRREIEASGLLITPGFIDIHTHYDGQVTWDSIVAPSSWQGVTSVVMGNCGVGFAPVKPGAHEFLVALMEGVEDIPGTALHEGLSWDWESFPEYLDAVDRRPHAIDIGAAFPHDVGAKCGVGERGADHEQDPTPDEIAKMARLTKEAIKAGALGFASSRSVGHRSRSGMPIGSLSASEEELLGIGQALQELGQGLLQFNSDFREGVDGEWELLCRLAAESKRPLSILLFQAAALLFQAAAEPERWRELLHRLDAAGRTGIDMKGQVSLRPIGFIIGLEHGTHPFLLTPTYRSIDDLPLAERVARMRDPGIRAQIIAEQPSSTGAGAALASTRAIESLFPLSDPPDYEPDPASSIGAKAQRRGVPVLELLYDRLIEDEGRALLYQAMVNYAEGNIEAAREMFLSERTVLGLSGGGAHVGHICDASAPTSNLTLWCRDRRRGERLPLESIVKSQTSELAAFVGWNDRGVTAPGYKADLNVIDFDRLPLRPPYVAHDLPLAVSAYFNERMAIVTRFARAKSHLRTASIRGRSPAGSFEGHGPHRSMAERRAAVRPRPAPPPVCRRHPARAAPGSSRARLGRSQEVLHANCA